MSYVLLEITTFWKIQMEDQVYVGEVSFLSLTWLQRRQKNKSLTLNKNTAILQRDKGNCTVVLDESQYKLNTLLKPGAYDLPNQ